MQLHVPLRRKASFRGLKQPQSFLFVEVCAWSFGGRSEIWLPRWMERLQHWCEFWRYSGPEQNWFVCVGQPSLCCLGRMRDAGFRVIDQCDFVCRTKLLSLSFEGACWDCLRGWSLEFSWQRSCVSLLHISHLLQYSALAQWRLYS